MHLLRCLRLFSLLRGRRLPLCLLNLLIHLVAALVDLLLEFLSRIIEYVFKLLLQLSVFRTPIAQLFCEVVIDFVTAVDVRTVSEKRGPDCV